MNIFVLDKDVNSCAEYHCDKHVLKMSIEYVQLLSTSTRLSAGKLSNQPFIQKHFGYKSTHENHPVAIWARESVQNWLWLRRLASAIHNEYTSRYGKIHKCSIVLASLAIPDLPDIGLTDYVLAMPNKYQTDCPIESYRNYYLAEKMGFAQWRNGDPKWITMK